LKGGVQEGVAATDRNFFCNCAVQPNLDAPPTGLPEVLEVSKPD
jgi:hypothetical protein